MKKIKSLYHCTLIHPAKCEYKTPVVVRGQDDCKCVLHLCSNNDCDVRDGEDIIHNVDCVTYIPVCTCEYVETVEINVKE